MEFVFDVGELLPAEMSMVSADPDCLGLIVEEIDPNNSTIDYTNNNWTHKSPCASHKITFEWKEKQLQLSSIIDQLGVRSGRAQQLSAPVTTGYSLLNSTHRLYILRIFDTKHYVVGMLKVGHKTLFIYDDYDNQYEQPDCLCVLDFYVIEEFQQKGYGLKLFEAMLKIESYEAGHVAYDAPSVKMFRFLKKHYNLERPVKQRTNVAIFREFFIDNEPGKERIPGYDHPKNVELPSGQQRKISYDDPSPPMLPFESRFVRRAGHQPPTSAAKCLVWDTPPEQAVAGSSSSTPASAQAPDAPDLSRRRAFREPDVDKDAI